MVLRVFGIACHQLLEGGSGACKISRAELLATARKRLGGIQRSGPRRARGDQQPQHRLHSPAKGRHPPPTIHFFGARVIRAIFPPWVSSSFSISKEGAPPPGEAARRRCNVACDVESSCTETMLEVGRICTA